MSPFKPATQEGPNHRHQLPAHLWIFQTGRPLPEEVEVCCSHPSYDLLQKEQFLSQAYLTDFQFIGRAAGEETRCRTPCGTLVWLAKRQHAAAVAATAHFWRTMRTPKSLRHRTHNSNVKASTSSHPSVPAMARSFRASRRKCFSNFRQPSRTIPRYYIVDPTVIEVPPTTINVPDRGAPLDPWKARTSVFSNATSNPNA